MRKLRKCNSRDEMHYALELQRFTDIKQLLCQAAAPNENHIAWLKLLGAANKFFEAAAALNSTLVEDDWPLFRQP
ncbi:hypothetical protein D3C81_2116480 [compost metagenome]